MVYPMRASDPTGTSSFEVYLAYFLGILLSLVELRVKAGAIFLLEVDGLELSAQSDFEHHIPGLEEGMSQFIFNKGATRHTFI